MDGFLEKIDGIWYVKWSDLHSFAHGTHWMWTQLHSDEIIDETLYKEGDKVKVRFTYDERFIAYFKIVKEVKDIKEIALELAEKYRANYKKWCEENPGFIMNGNMMKEDAAKKASFCKNVDELKAMRTYYDVALRSAEGTNGFRFSRDAMDEILEELSSGYSEDDDEFYAGIV
jgi:hypothetical protein